MCAIGEKICRMKKKNNLSFLWLSEIFKFFYVECFFSSFKTDACKVLGKIFSTKYFLRTEYFEGPCTSKLTILHSRIEFNMDEIRWRSQAIRYSEQREAKCFEEIDRWCWLGFFTVQPRLNGTMKWHIFADTGARNLRRRDNSFLRNEKHTRSMGCLSECQWPSVRTFLLYLIY